MIAPPPTPLVLALNARAADGRDTSWLWDVPFERLLGRTIAVTGDRRLDMRVRLSYARVESTMGDDLRAALRTLPAGPVDVVANYTALRDVMKALNAR